MPTSLSPARRTELRGEAHSLKPVVMIGDKGLTEVVLAEIDRALKAHELIKVKAATDDREARDAWLAKICEALQAHPVQQIGKVLVIYRENPEPAPAARKPEPAKPKAEKRDPRRKPGRDPEVKRSRLKRPAETVITGTSRRRSRTPSPLPASGLPRRRQRTSR